jgi:hypothetical protein
VNNHYHPEHGYTGLRHIEKEHFKGTEVRDGRGHSFRK